MSSDLESVREKLLLEAEKRDFKKKSRETKTASVRALRAEIAALRRKGATWGDVADMLRSAGVDVNKDTVRLAIGETKKREPGTSTSASPKRAKAAEGNGRKSESGPKSKTKATDAKFGAAGVEL